MKKIVAFILGMILLFSLYNAFADMPSDIISDFSEGLARMKKSSLYGYIDKNGNWIIDAKYSYGALFSEGLVYVEDGNGHKQFLKTDGTMVLDVKRKYINSSPEFHEDMLWVIEGDGQKAGINKYRYFYVDVQGNKLLPKGNTIYDNADDFSEGLAHVSVLISRTSNYSDNDYDAYIDTTGKEVIAFDDAFLHFTPGLQYCIHTFGTFKDGYAVLIADVFDSAGMKKYGSAFLIIDTTGKICTSIESQYENYDYDAYVRNCGNGIFAIVNEINNTYYYINAHGERLTDETYGCWFEKDSYEWMRFSNQYEYCFSDGIALVGIDRKGRIIPSYIDTKGNILIQDSWDDACAFSEGLASVCKDGKWGYINAKGEYIIQPQYDQARPFHCGVAIVDLEKDWFIIDTRGNILY